MSANSPVRTSLSLPRPDTHLFRTSRSFSHALTHTRPILLESKPSEPRRPVPENPPGTIIPDNLLSNPDTATQSDPVTTRTQSRYSVTATSSDENQVSTVTDEDYSAHFSHDSGPSISDSDHRPTLSLTSHDNQDQQTFEPPGPSIYVSWLGHGHDTLSLPAQPYDNLNEGLGGLEVLDKEISRTSLSRTGSTRKDEYNDGTRGGNFMLTQHESQPVQSLAHSWTSIDTHTAVQEGTKADHSTSSLATSTQWIQEDPAISRINWSMQISKQGIELILGSVVGGSLVFISIVLLHRRVLRSIRSRSEQHLPPLSLAKDSSSRIPGTHMSEVVEVSHFSIDS